MLTLLLAAALIAVLGYMVVRRRHLTILMGVASLLAGMLLLIWMQSMGLLPGTDGPMTSLRPQTLEDTRH